MPYWIAARCLTLLFSILTTLTGLARLHGTPIIEVAERWGFFLVLPSLIVFLLMEALVSRLSCLAEGSWPPYLYGLYAAGWSRQIRTYDRLHRSVEAKLDARAGRHDDAKADLRGTSRIERSMLRDDFRLQAEIKRLLTHFPPRDQITATRLGNTLRASQARVSERYGMDLMVVYPRLLALLPRERRKAVDKIELALKMWTRLSAIFFVSTCLSWVFVPSVLSAALPEFAASTLASAALITTLALGVFSLACYGESIRKAVLFGIQVEVIFDLHRLDLLRTMNLPVPKDIENQRHLFSLLSRLLQGQSLHGIEFVYDTGATMGIQERREITRIGNQYIVGQAMAVGQRAQARARKARFHSRRTSVAPKTAGGRAPPAVQR